MLSKRHALHVARHRLHALQQASDLGLRTVVTIINIPRQPEALSAPSEKSKETHVGGTKRPAELLKPRGPAAALAAKEDPLKVQKPKKLLKPYDLATRLKKLCFQGDIDGAVEMLQNMPLDSQTPPVWNTLIMECMKAKRYKLACRLFTDMKRRGLKPTVRTYDTLLYGLSQIKDWENHMKLLENAHSLYGYLIKHYELVKKLDSKSSELDVNPLASYINILADTKEYTKIFDVYYALDKDGPLVPNNLIYTAILRALATRKAAPDQSAESVAAQNASEARLLWTQMMARPGAASDFPADSHTVAAALRCLAYGRLADHRLGMDIAQNVLGLSKPEGTPLKPKVPLHPQSLDAILALCNNMGVYRTCIHFARQVMDKPRKFHQKSFVDRGHINHVLKAYASLAVSGDTTVSPAAFETLQWMLDEDIKSGDEKTSKIRPNIRTFHLVLTACQHCKDWLRATRVFEIMTGYHAEDFLKSSKSPRRDRRSPGHSHFPDATTMASMARTALATGDTANIRQCLRIVDHLQFSRILASDGLRGPEDPSNTSMALLQKHAVHGTELVTAVLDMLQVTTKADDGMPEAAGSQRWRHLGSEARELLQSPVATRLRSTY